MLRTAVVVTLLCLLVACGPPGGPDGGTGGGTGTAACQGVPARTLDVVYPKYFAAGVATSCLNAGCHSSGSGGLTFDTEATFYAATVGKPATSDATKTLVKPSDPDQSWLFDKLLPSAVGAQMPSGGPYLDAAGQDEVKGWICAGAPAGTGGGGGSNAPTVTGFSPTQGLVGTTVTVTGTGFATTPAGNAVAFNGTAATVSSATRTSVVATVPAGSTTGPVSVTVAGATGTSAASFTVQPGNAIPVVSGLSPCGKVAGTGAFTLTVNGQNFMSGTTVTFKGTALTATFVSATQLTVAVTAGLVAAAPAGNVTEVVVTNPTPGGGASQPADFGVAGAVSTLAGQVQPVFTANCATAGCHNAASTAAGLNLSSGASYGQLVGVASSECTNKLRVRACSPTRAASMLIDKMLATGASPACSGTQMPKGAPLTAIEKQKIVDWVAQGAPQ